MSFFRGIVDSLGSIFADGDSPPYGSHRRQGSGSPDPPLSMDAGGGGAAVTSVANERTAYKLKGYFDLAKEEIAKAVRAEEWGLVDDAIAHYRNAQRILLEGSSTPVPSYISSREQEKVKSYRRKISKWQDQVSDRLQALGRRAGVASTSKSTLTNAHAAPVSSTASNGLGYAIQNSPPSRNNRLVRSQTEKAASAKPAQDSGNGYEAKLVEMINTAIVDRSPSVKWEDVAGLDKAKQALMEMVILPTKRRDLFTGLRRPARDRKNRDIPHHWKCRIEPESFCYRCMESM